MNTHPKRHNRPASPVSRPLLIPAGSRKIRANTGVLDERFKVACGAGARPVFFLDPEGPPGSELRRLGHVFMNNPG